MRYCEGYVDISEGRCIELDFGTDKIIHKLQNPFTVNLAHVKRDMSTPPSKAKDTFRFEC